MPSMPLHPALVHLPLGLAFVMPFVAAFLVWALVTGRAPRRTWWLAVGLQALLLAGGLAALKVGQDEEEVVERFVPESAIHRHEEYAEGLLWASGLVLGLSLAVLGVPDGRASRVLSALAAAGTLMVAGLAVRTGHAGGQLVYVHHAAAAYARTATGDAGGPVPARTARIPVIEVTPRPSLSPRSQADR